MAAKKVQDKDSIVITSCIPSETHAVVSHSGSGGQRTQLRFTTTDGPYTLTGLDSCLKKAKNKENLTINTPVGPFTPKPGTGGTYYYGITGDQCAKPKKLDVADILVNA